MFLPTKSFSSFKSFHSSNYFSRHQYHFLKYSHSSLSQNQEKFAEMGKWFQMNCKLNLEVIFVIFLFNLFTSVPASVEDRTEIFKKKIREDNVELRDWDPPIELKKALPYYLSGYDYEDRPIWFLEFGKWDLRTLLENADRNTTSLFEKYMDQMYYRFHNSPKQWAKNKENPGSEEWAYFCDMEHYNLRQLTSTKVLQHLLYLSRNFDVAGSNLAYLIGVNVNYFGTRLADLMKPALGKVFARIEIYGTNKDIWIPKVLRKIPKESLAEWYGGVGNYTPIAVYG